MVLVDPDGNGFLSVCEPIEDFFLEDVFFAFFVGYVLLQVFEPMNRAYLRCTCFW